MNSLTWHCALAGGPPPMRFDLDHWRHQRGLQSRLAYVEDSIRGFHPALDPRQPNPRTKPTLRNFVWLNLGSSGHLPHFCLLVRYEYIFIEAALSVRQARQSHNTSMKALKHDNHTKAGKLRQSTIVNKCDNCINQVRGNTLGSPNLIPPCLERDP